MEDIKNNSTCGECEHGVIKPIPRHKIDGVLCQNPQSDNYWEMMFKSASCKECKPKPNDKPEPCKHFPQDCQFPGGLLICQQECPEYWAKIGKSALTNK